MSFLICMGSIKKYNKLVIRPLIVKHNNTNIGYLCYNLSKLMRYIKNKGEEYEPSIYEIA